MRLTDYESGIIFELDIHAFGAVYNRGSYREVRTIDSDYFKASPKYKVRETVPEIIKQAHEEGAKGDA